MVCNFLHTSFTSCNSTAMMMHYHLKFSVYHTRNYSLAQVDRSKKKVKPADKEKMDVIGLPWMVRISIAMDTARGLCYLHRAIKDTPLVHRDVKRLVIEIV